MSAVILNEANNEGFYIFFMNANFICLKLAHRQQLVAESTLADDTCQTRDPAFADNGVC